MNLTLLPCLLQYMLLLVLLIVLIIITKSSITALKQIVIIWLGKYIVKQMVGLRFLV